MDFATFLIQCLNAVQYGLLLFLVASGLTLIFGIMGVINLAHGSFYMIGAYMAYALAPVVGAAFGGEPVKALAVRQARNRPTAFFARTDGHDGGQVAAHGIEIGARVHGQQARFVELIAQQLHADGKTFVSFRLGKADRDAHAWQSGQ